MLLSTGSSASRPHTSGISAREDFPGQGISTWLELCGPLAPGGFFVTGMLWGCARKPAQHDTHAGI